MEQNVIELPGRLELSHWFSDNTENNAVMLVPTNRTAQFRKTPSRTQDTTRMIGTRDVSLSQNGGNVSDRMFMESLVNLALAMVAYNPPSILKHALVPCLAVYCHKTAGTTTNRVVMARRKNPRNVERTAVYAYLPEGFSDSTENRSSPLVSNRLEGVVNAAVSGLSMGETPQEGGEMRTGCVVEWRSDLDARVRMTEKVTSFPSNNDAEAMGAVLRSLHSI